MKNLLYILILILPIIGLAQERQKGVVVSTGSTAEINGGVYSYNIGQSFVSTVNNTDIVVTQGFFQPIVVPCLKHAIQKTGNNICDQTQNEVELSLVSSVTYDTYSWYYIDETDDTLKVFEGSTTTYKPSYPGTYFVKYKGFFCENSSEVSVVRLESTAEIPTINDNNGVLSTAVVGASSYQWFVTIGGQKYAIHNQTGASYSTIFDAEYSVEVTYGSGNCRVMSLPRTAAFAKRGITSDNVTFSGNTVYLSLEDESTVNVYPYPSYESFSLDVLSEDIGVVTVRLIDMKGTVVNVQHLEKESPLLKAEISTANLSEGLYSVIIQTANTVHTTKMLILE